VAPGSEEDCPPQLASSSGSSSSAARLGIVHLGIGPESITLRFPKCSGSGQFGAIVGPVRRKARSAALLGLALVTLRCTNPLDACAPTESRLGFFAQGDCVLSRASFFQGHEWLTWFGNRDLPEADRFSDAEIQQIAEGNRRVDWPKELLIHLNSSIVAYLNAVIEYGERPENQRMHFLLSDRNDSREAAADSRAEIERLTLEAVRDESRDRKRALTRIGRACHVLQDSFSEAHTVREPDHPERPWCIRKLKSYIARAPGYGTPDIEYHGGDGSDGVGHTTTLDSIYRAGRDCHEPDGAERVEACLSETSTRARLGTRDYLALVRRLLALGSEHAELERRVKEELEGYAAQHLEFCP
jgi:hypothetical protein